MCLYFMQSDNEKSPNWPMQTIQGLAKEEMSKSNKESERQVK
jgi:hypothetical protein